MLRHLLPERCSVGVFCPHQIAFLLQPNFEARLTSSLRIPAVEVSIDAVQECLPLRSRLDANSQVATLELYQHISLSYSLLQVLSTPFGPGQRQKLVRGVNVAQPSDVYKRQHTDRRRNTKATRANPTTKPYSTHPKAQSPLFRNERVVLT